jgi:hypothetical protein
MLAGSRRERKPCPSVHAAHAVDGYLLDEQFVHFEDVFFVPFGTVF